MPYFDSDNVKLYYEDIGDGQPVVFLHGFTLDSRMWRSNIPALSENNRLILLDARGHGKSSAPETDYAREDRARDILNLADYLEFDKFHLAGMSMGGGDAICFAIDHGDRLNYLALVSSVIAGWTPSRKYHDFSVIARKEGVRKAKLKYKKSILSRYDANQKEIRDELECMIDSFSGQPWLDPMKGKYPIRNEMDLLHTINPPTGVIVGKHDIYFRPLAERMNKLIPGSILKIIPNSGHMVNMEAPIDFNKALVSFLENLDQ